jgi:hypothetical protein
MRTPGNLRSITYALSRIALAGLLRLCMGFGRRSACRIVESGFGGSSYVFATPEVLRNKLENLEGVQSSVGQQPVISSHKKPHLAAAA